MRTATGEQELKSAEAGNMINQGSAVKRKCCGSSSNHFVVIYSCSTCGFASQHKKWLQLRQVLLS